MFFAVPDWTYTIVSYKYFMHVKNISHHSIVCVYTPHTHMDFPLKIYNQKKSLCRYVHLFGLSILDNSFNPMQMNTYSTFSICIFNLQILRLFFTSV